MSGASAWATTPVVISSTPDQVGITIYQDPNREEIKKDQPSSLAFIYETRRLILPPGPVTIRFEGVAGGILPQSAIIYGANPRERNRDAALLSRGGLVDAFTGQQVILRRTDTNTGQVNEETATIRSAADRLVVMTSRGAEAMSCTGLNQTLIYPQAPENLSAKPVLSMTTKDQPGGAATITLAYLATGFDWEANYVGILGGDGKSLSLMSWLTLVSGDQTSFVDATTSAVAGRVRREYVNPEMTYDDDSQNYECWPADTTSDVPAFGAPRTTPAPMRMMMKREGAEEVVVVTGTRRQSSTQGVPIAVTAVSENLGDLKLFRIPIPVTVAAQSQKQVAFLAPSNIQGQLLYRVSVSSSWAVHRLFRFRNNVRSGLGKPLPAGGVILYQDGDLGRQLVGETSIEDKTIDEEVEFDMGENDSIEIEEVKSERKTRGGKNFETMTVAFRNTNPFAVRLEVEFPTDGDVELKRLPKTIEKPGKRVWSTEIAANSERRVTIDIYATD